MVPFMVFSPPPLSRPAVRFPAGAFTPDTAAKNNFYGSIDGRFIAPKAIHALGSVPPGSKAVVIHPDVQARMEQDADYAKQIMEKIR